jgi:tripartite-type tricarboxylate transporter receptor subunit TctC
MRTTLTRRAALQTLLAAAAASAAPALAQAPGYPNRPIRIICAFPVGGIADTFSRLIGQKLSDAWGQPVVIENRTGAGGNIGADAVAKSPNDGYTILMSNIGTHAVNVHLMKSLPFDPVKDFVPIAHVLEAEGLLVVHPSVPATTVPEVIALAKAQPGKLSYASAGPGTTSHLAGELFKSIAKVDIIHVPYKGNAPAINDLLGGQSSMIFATMPTVLPQVKAGKLRAIAVIGNARAAALPDTPTVAETLPGFEVSNWIGLFAPAGTPLDIVNRINAEVQKIMRTPDMVKRLEAEGAKFVPLSAAQFGEFQKDEIAKWGKTIREANIKIE